MKATWIIAIALIVATGCSPEKKTQATAPEKAPEPTAPAAATQTVPPTPTPAPAPTVAEAKPVISTQPKLQFFPKPIYPTSMQDQCIEGEVSVTMRVDTDGHPQDIKVDSSTNQAFTDALMAVLPSWRFIPAQRDGVAVVRNVSIAIPFVITNRPLDTNISGKDGKPALLGVTRPRHPGKGPANVVAEFTLTSDTLVSGVKILSSEGQIDEKALVETLNQWIFLPTRNVPSDQPTTQVTAEITFTKAGNVLIQYPYTATPAVAK